MTQATDAGAIEKLVVDAALAIASKVGWEQLRLHAIADRTGRPLAEIGRRFRDVDAVANAWFSQARIALLGLPQDELDGRSADERIALALGVWLDSLAPHRRLAGEILRHKLYVSYRPHEVLTDPFLAPGRFLSTRPEAIPMPAPLPIRSDRSPAELRRLARHERDGRVSARLMALANALEDIPREEAARLASMTGQTLGDRVHRYNAEGVAGLRDRPRAGRHSRLSEGQQAALKALVLRGPDLKRDGCIAWRARDLCRLVEQRFGVSYKESGMLRLLHSLEFSWQKPRPVHPEADAKVQAGFKKPARADARYCRASPGGRTDRAVVRG